MTKTSHALTLTYLNQKAGRITEVPVSFAAHLSDYT